MKKTTIAIERRHYGGKDEDKWHHVVTARGWFREATRVERGNPELQGTQFVANIPNLFDFEGSRVVIDGGVFDIGTSLLVENHCNCADPECKEPSFCTRLYLRETQGKPEVTKL